MAIRIIQAGPEWSREAAIMTGELMVEIVKAIHRQGFHFDLAEAEARLHGYLSDGTYHAFVAVDETQASQAVGFITAYESRAIYAEGRAGNLPELYVRPAYRRRGIGRSLMAAIKALGRQRGWKRLEVTTPPLPAFQGALAFYERAGFTVTGNRTLQLEL